MRIALLTYSTKPRGGVVHTLALAEALADLGHAVDVWSLGRGGDTGFFRPVDPRVTVRLVPFADLPDETVGARIVRSIAELRAAFGAAERQRGYDIVHAQDCISANAVDRCIRTVHHLDSFTTPELIACHERAIRNPYAHLCVSAAVASEVRQGWGITPVVLGNGIDSARFAAAATPAAAGQRQAWQAELGRFVLSVGGVEPRKGTADLVEAMAIAQRRDPDLKLVIAGGETLFDYRPYRARLEERAAELGLNWRILGPVEHAALPSLLAAAAAFAFPSTKEGFGLAAMEALAAGVPLVLRELPVLHEVFGDTGYYGSDPAELADALGTAIAERGTPAGDRRAAAGRALAGQHRWADVAAKHVDFYRAHPLR